MKETNLDIASVPSEPTYAFNLSVCPVSRLTCCTYEIERQMVNVSHSKMERLVQVQINMIRRFFDDYYNSFLEHLKEALHSNQRQLDEMFSRTYGPFYRRNSKIVSDFYEDIEAFLVSDSSEKSIKAALNKMFRSMYSTIFALMNPLRNVGSSEKECMFHMKPKLKPFGSLPKQVRIHLERSLSAWKSLLYSIREVSQSLNEILQSKLPSNCMPSLVRMNMCHVCVGANPLAKPCAKYCINVLKGCFAEFSEMDTQWNSILAVFNKISNRLKEAYNPNSVLSPIPVQISEGIMLFQENGATLSNRIISRCFQSSIRVARDLSTYETNDIMASLKETPKVHQLKHRYQADNIKRLTDAFIEKLSRLKGFWRSLPQTLCMDGQMATFENDQCWNGKSLNGYQKKVVASGISAQRFNSEFEKPFQLSREKFLDIRIKWLTITHQLESVYDGEIFNQSSYSSNYYEGSAFAELSISPDDEDTIEGSANEIHMTQESLYTG
uniref:Uncharacterized protein n=1 Tax=Acrobeloides nanus TaxID=290746 RepID=A0A914BUB6_9BILA